MGCSPHVVVDEISIETLGQVPSTEKLKLKKKSLNRSRRRVVVPRRYIIGETRVVRTARPESARARDNYHRFQFVQFVIDSDVQELSFQLVLGFRQVHVSFAETGIHRFPRIAHVSSAEHYAKRTQIRLYSRDVHKNKVMRAIGVTGTLKHILKSTVHTFYTNRGNLFIIILCV